MRQVMSKELVLKTVRNFFICIFHLHLHRQTMIQSSGNSPNLAKTEKSIKKATNWG